MATIKRRGYGQVEPNHLSGIVTGQIYAQLPVADDMGKVIENGRFAKYDYKEGKVNLSGPGEWMLIYNEEKLYDPARQGHRYFAMTPDGDGEIVPRLIATVVGDIFTTNAFNEAAASGDAEVTEMELDLGDNVCVDKSTGYLKKVDTELSLDLGPVFNVVKIYTMADGQDGVKLMRIQ